MIINYGMTLIRIYNALLDEGKLMLVRSNIVGRWVGEFTGRRYGIRLSEAAGWSDELAVGWRVSADMFVIL